MHRVHVVFAVLAATVAAGQEMGARGTGGAPASSWPPPSLAIRAYMGSVDYGGQPPGYGRIPGPAFPVDRRTGALTGAPSRSGPDTGAGGRTNGGQQLDQNPGQQQPQPVEQPTQPGRHKPGFWEKLWHLAGDVVDTAKTGIHNTVAKTKSWFGK